MADTASIRTLSLDPQNAKTLAERIQEAGLLGPAALARAESSAQAPVEDFVTLLTSAAGSPVQDSFVPPFQLGLQAAQNPTQGSQAPELLAAQPSEAAAILAPAAVSVDPTQSSLFQAHLGALATQLGPSTAALNQGLPESTLTLRVAATSAGAPTLAFAEGRPSSAEFRELGRTGPPEGLAQTSAVPGAGEADAAAYNLAGGAIPRRMRPGTLLDLTG